MRTVKALVPLSAAALTLFPANAVYAGCDTSPDSYVAYFPSCGCWACAGYYENNDCTYCWDTGGGESCYTYDAWCCHSGSCCPDPNGGVQCAE
jgi:hypothetical protein